MKYTVDLYQELNQARVSVFDIEAPDVHFAQLRAVDLMKDPHTWQCTGADRSVGQEDGGKYYVFAGKQPSIPMCYHSTQRAAVGWAENVFDTWFIREGRHGPVVAHSGCNVIATIINFVQPHLQDAIKVV